MLLFVLLPGERFFLYQNKSTYRDVTLTPSFLRGWGFWDGLYIRNSGCFSKSFSRAGSWATGEVFSLSKFAGKHGCSLLCMNLISVEKEADFFLLFSPGKFNPMSSSGGSKPQCCRIIFLHSAQALSHLPPLKRGEPLAITGSSSIKAAPAVNWLPAGTKT